MSKLSLSHHTYKQNRLTGVFSRRTRFIVGYIRRRLSTGHANFEKLHVPDRCGGHLPLFAGYANSGELHGKGLKIVSDAQVGMYFF
jgi:hypothetical protein